MAGYPWYNNGILEIQIKPDKKVPTGYVRGRLPRTEESKKKQSNSLKGHKGYWTGKSMPKDSRGETSHRQFVSGSRTQWNKGLTKQTSASVQKMSNSLQGHTAWNKGLTAETDERVAKYVNSWRVGNANQKSITTKTNNNSFHTSKVEDEYYEYLRTKYGSDDVCRQYSDSRYPYSCDFYILSEDLFIELNKHWTHGGHPFNAEDDNDISKLRLWEEKSLTSKFYKNAIYTWTDLDVRKQQCAKENNLNYKIIY